LGDRREPAVDHADRHDFANSQQDSSAVTLASGDSSQLTLSWETSASTTTGTGNVTVASQNETATQSVTVSPYARGDGSASDPYEIETWDQLDDIRKNLDANFTLVNDLNETTTGYDAVASGSANGGNGFLPLARDTTQQLDFQGTAFTGTFNGTGHTIANLSIGRENMNRLGLFGYVDGGTIENVGVENADITG
jgi:hypothetical protein